jgi:hypothetical protein
MFFSEANAVLEPLQGRVSRRMVDEGRGTLEEVLCVRFGNYALFVHPCPPRTLRRCIDEQMDAFFGITKRILGEIGDATRKRLLHFRHVTIAVLETGKISIDRYPSISPINSASCRLC